MLPKQKRKFSIFVKILAAFILLAGIPVAISGFLTASTYQEVYDKYINLQPNLVPVGDTDLSLTQQNVKIQVSLIIFLVVILSSFVSILLGRSLSRPLKELVKGTKAISAGNLEIKIPVSSRDEIGDLAASFNQMAVDLKQSRDKLEAQRDELNKNVKMLAKRDDELSLAYEQIKQERDKTESVFSNLTDGIVVIDTEGKISSLNPRVEDLLNISAAEVINKKIPTNTSSAPLKYLHQIINLPASEKHKSLPEITIKEPFEIILQVATAPVLDAKGQLLGVMKILHDITREKAIDKMKSEFISVAAHQLRTPLSAIKWTLKMILDGDLGIVSDEQKEFLTRGYQSNERMIGLVNDLLDVSRIEEGRFRFQPTGFALDKLIESVIEEVKPNLEKEGVSLVFDDPKEKVPPVFADQNRIRLVLHNLIDNAIRYNLPKGKVTIDLKYTKSEAEVCIADTGVGIPKNQLSRLFTKFFRADNVIKMQTEGTGLGLFIVKNIIERHKGRVWVESEEGKGTKMYFTLPLST